MRIEELSPYVEKGSVVLDIGANIGEVTELLSELVGASGHVLAFEPGTKVWEILGNKKFPHDNVVLARLALGDRKDELDVFHHHDWTLLPAGDPRQKDNVYPPGSFPHGLKQPSAFRVKVSTLDEFLNENDKRLFYHPPRISFIKIDVDGWEARVIQGALGTIQTHRPKILMEIGRYTMKKIGDVPIDCIRPLFQRGYLAFDFATGTSFQSAEELEMFVPHDQRTIDALFFPVPAP